MCHNIHMSCRRNAFTLIELLIAVAITAILIGSALFVINPPALLAKSRDATRIRDIKTISSAIELYKIDNRLYPVSASFIAITGSDTLSSALLNGYIRSIPLDPLQATSPSTDPCNRNVSGTPNYRYNYISEGTGKWYVITAQTEVASSATPFACSKLVKSYCPSNPYCAGIESKAL